MQPPRPQGPTSWRLLEAASLLRVEPPSGWTGSSTTRMAVVASRMGTAGTREPAFSSCDVVLVLGGVAVGVEVVVVV